MATDKRLVILSDMVRPIEVFDLLTFVFNLISKLPKYDISAPNRRSDLQDAVAGLQPVPPHGGGTGV
jgi:hypothetical protein